MLILLNLTQRCYKRTKKKQNRARKIQALALPVATRFLSLTPYMTPRRFQSRVLPGHRARSQHSALSDGGPQPEDLAKWFPGLSTSFVPPPHQISGFPWSGLITGGLSSSQHDHNGEGALCEAGAANALITD